MSDLRVAFDGRCRYVLRIVGGSVRVYRYAQLGSYAIPYSDGTTFKTVAAGSSADIDYWHNALVVDVDGTSTYVSYDNGEHWSAI